MFFGVLGFFCFILCEKFYMLWIMKLDMRFDIKILNNYDVKIYEFCYMGFICYKLMISVMIIILLVNLRLNEILCWNLV